MRARVRCGRSRARRCRFGSAREGDGSPRGLASLGAIAQGAILPGGGDLVGGVLLRVEGLVKEFGLRRSAAERVSRAPGVSHRAVDDVSLSLTRGEIPGLAGGSGSGKTTLARCIIRLVEPDAGSIVLDGVDVRAARGAELRELRRRMQMV